MPDRTYYPTSAACGRQSGMMRRLLGFVLISVAAGFAQTAAPAAFEAAAIKPSPEGGGIHYSSGNGRVSMKNMSVRGIIQTAYKVTESQVSGPSWIDKTYYSIEAKADSRAQDAELMRMVQALLADRFKLVLHHEQKMVPGYAVVVAKGGIKMKPVEGDKTSSHGEGNKIIADRQDMAGIIRIVERTLGQPVVDETKLKGGYAFVLEFERRPRPADSDATAGPLEAPSLFTALSQQLGLKLEPRKLPVEMLFVDRVEHPSDN